MDSSNITALAATLVAGAVVAGVTYMFSATQKRNNVKESEGTTPASSAAGECGHVVVTNDDFGGVSGRSPEICRDFARYFTSRAPAVFVFRPLRWEAAASDSTKAEAPALRPFHATVPNVDFVAESNNATIENFRSLLAGELEAAGVVTAPGGDNDSAAAAEYQVPDWLLTACVRCITISVGFKFAMEVTHCPVLLQPTFVVAASPRQVHVVMYAFVGGNQKQVGSKAAGAKCTDSFVRIRSPNLLDCRSAAQEQDGAGREMRFYYDIFPAVHTTAIEEVQRDVKRTRGCLGIPRAH
eukprot:INCI2467.1.p1 GENE.INCI2467.1~~INCI2467.1.p1  ORF type:complete len:297 (-),score=52.37 INCI2467.1:255-1145(-)